MKLAHTLIHLHQSGINRIRHFDGLAPLLLRLYLAPVLIQAGWNKYQNFSNIVDWFGNTEWGLGLPLPWLMAFLATAAELIGGLFLLLGLLTRLVTIPLMITMLVAIFSVHWQNGWLAIADASSWLADGTLILNQNILDSVDKLAAANSILETHGRIDWLTSSGKLVVLNNGIEFAATYWVMLFALLFMGGGRYTSLDFWILKRINKN